MSIQATGRRATTSFVWGAAEASVFFVIPDVLLCWPALVAPRRLSRSFVAAIGGALVGATALYALSRPLRDELEMYFVSLPGIRAADLAAARRAVEWRGSAALLQVPLRGQPIKLYVYHAALKGIPLSEVLAYVALNRLVRLGASALPTVVAGWILRRRIKSHPRLTAVAYICGWSLFYADYWRRRGG